MQSSNQIQMCTQYSTNSCCTGLHDKLIQMTLQSDAVNSSPDLRNYMCFGCSFVQPQVTDEATKTIRICKGFAERLWSGKENNGVEFAKTQNIYDDFGLRHKDGKTILIQSQDLTNATDFFNKVLPPFFEDYQISIVDNDPSCYNLALSGSFTSVLVVALFIISFLSL